MVLEDDAIRTSCQRVMYRKRLDVRTCSETAIFPWPGMMSVDKDIGNVRGSRAGHEEPGHNQQLRHNGPAIATSTVINMREFVT